ncbi:hypothetical protein KW823_00510 [Enterobacter quasiroggenkampii]|nr:hypothetical protein [Enterobacter quasiroggenkampii]
MKKVNDLKDRKSQYPLYDKALSTWYNMFTRVERKHQYCNVQIQKEWYEFSHFYRWFSNNYIPGFELDKDLLSLSNGTKMYSESTCLFVPKEVNSLFRVRDSKTGVKGVYEYGNKFNARIWYNGVPHDLGVFSDIDEAQEHYVQALKQRLYDLSGKYSNYTTLSQVLYVMSK